jgi:hypothetical protein
MLIRVCFYTNSLPEDDVIWSKSTRWFKYDRDKLWLVYTQSVPVIFEPPCMLTLSWVKVCWRCEIVIVPRNLHNGVTNIKITWWLRNYSATCAVLSLWGEITGEELHSVCYQNKNRTDKSLRVSFRTQSLYTHSSACPNPFSKYKVVQIWPRQTVTCLHTISPGHIWTTLYKACRCDGETEDEIDVADHVCRYGIVMPHLSVKIKLQYFKPFSSVLFMFSCAV